MDKNSILLIGAGKTGNIFVSEMMSLDKRYTGLMINSSMKDMENLPNFDRVQSYSIPGEDGSGRNREKGKQFIKNRGSSILDIIQKNKQSEVAVFFCSADGGTGSGSTPLLIKAFRKPNPNKKVILVAIMPRLSENMRSLQNTQEFWNDIIELKKNSLIDTIYLVDNNKRKSLTEINKEATRKLDLAFSLDTLDKYGDIDKHDSKNINTAKGYSIILELGSKFNKIEDEIDYSIKDSVFVLPSSYDCDYMGAVLDENGHDIGELKSKFNVYISDYCGKSNGENIVVLSGLNMPKEVIELVQMALQDLSSSKKSHIQDDDNLFVSVNNSVELDTNSIKVNAENNHTKELPSNLSNSIIDDVLDDAFWDN